MYMYQDYLSLGIVLKERKYKTDKNCFGGKCKTMNSLKLDNIPVQESFNPKCEECCSLKCTNNFNPTFRRE